MVDAKRPSFSPNVYQLKCKTGNLFDLEFNIQELQGKIRITLFTRNQDTSYNLNHDNYQESKDSIEKKHDLREGGEKYYRDSDSSDIDANHTSDGYKGCNGKSGRRDVYRSDKHKEDKEGYDNSIDTSKHHKLNRYESVSDYIKLKYRDKMNNDNGSVGKSYKSIGHGGGSEEICSFGEHDISETDSSSGGK
ncbi:hypothetical protein K7432_015428 [Basidiobolus ranarum]|uniref:Uncharacterized protein n=1 Tax=Basidiobolus ranarum TaxID=34480 RepID=A0ABR2WG50_9FUNG